MKTPAIIDHIRQWLKDYNQKAGTSGFVVGVSGGIDSALTSTLAAMTDEEVICLEMPIYQSLDQVNRALEHIGWLQDRHPKVRFESIDLTPVYNAMVEQLPPVKEEKDRELALANTRARLRMSTLYYFAGLEGKLVVGTGNKVEDFGVGFFTKYGDGGVDLSPIADLNKTEVYALAKELNIIDAIQNAAPTDGLFGDARTDEDQLGASYPELEWAMEFSGNPDELSGRKKEVYEIFSRLNKANKHKIEPIPVCEIPKDLK